MTSATLPQADGATIGQRLRRLREERGLSLAELAFETWERLPRRYHVTPETIRLYEGDRVKKHDFITVLTICDALNVPLAAIAPELVEERKRIEALIARSR